MNGVILYQSKYGTTKKYANWLSKETRFPCMETRTADIHEIAKYDTIILGGGLYASGIAGLSFLSFIAVARGIWMQCLLKTEHYAVYSERRLQRKIRRITKYGKKH